ncbi:hypothetical protein Adt_43430 [Abeliophyllum distichum]|uniref:Uncharacterized protein n=1 Tax=Abeliophyllum distichum TaxID=126358 RepID=A0ABD1P805_9LAMI
MTTSKVILASVLLSLLVQTIYNNDGTYKKRVLEAPRGIGELVRPDVTWGEIFRQRRFDSREGQIFAEILWGSVLGVGLLAFSLRSLPLVHIPRFTTRLVKGPLTQVGDSAFETFPYQKKRVLKNFT